MTPPNDTGSLKNDTVRARVKSAECGRPLTSKGSTVSLEQMGLVPICSSVYFPQAGAQVDTFVVDLGCNPARATATP